MYIWRIDALKAQLISRAVPEVDRFRYLLLFVGLSGLSTALARLFPPTTPWDIVEPILALLISVIGTIACFRANGGRFGQNFMERYMALVWVFGLRFSLVVLLPGSIILYIGLALMCLQGESMSIYEMVFWAACIVTFYRRLAQHVKDVSQPITAEPRGAADPESGLIVNKENPA